MELETLQLKYGALQEEQSEAQKTKSFLEQEITALNEELAAKDELLEEANNFITDFNEEKHELKAKFKLLMGTLNNDNSVSSYQSTDEIDLD